MNETSTLINNQSTKQSNHFNTHSNNSINDAIHSTNATSAKTMLHIIGATPRQRAILIQTISVPFLIVCAVWIWSDASHLPNVPGLADNIDLNRQRSTSFTLGWMFMFESLGQLSLILASHRHVMSEDISRGDLSDTYDLPVTSVSKRKQGKDIHVDFHHWMKSEDTVKRWSSFVSYLCFIVLVSLCRFDIAGQALDSDIIGSYHSTTLLLCIIILFGPQLVGALWYITTSSWPVQWYGAIIFLMCPFIAGVAMLWRYANSVNRNTDHSFWGGIVLLMYMGPFLVYTLGEPYVERWHMELMSIFVWLMLAVAGRGMML
jgi:small-conductance mechanosensitive channel